MTRTSSVKRWEKQVAEAEARVALLEDQLEGMQKEIAMASADEAFNCRLDAQKALEGELAYASAQSALRRPSARAPPA